MMRILLFIVAANLFSNKKELVELKFMISQDEKIYEESVYGEPPQFAIWIENVETKEKETVFITESTGNNDFEGRSEVLVALPIWLGTFQKNIEKTSYDGITGPTPLVESVEFKKEVLIGSKWNYYIEVNVAGDFNSSFPLYQEDGAMDAYGNGQPSIVYSGAILAMPGESSKPLLIGRSKQMYYDKEVTEELGGVKSAKYLFSNINVACNKK